MKQMRNLLTGIFLMLGMLLTTLLPTGAMKNPS